MFYQYFLTKNKPSLSRLSGYKTTERTCDVLQTTVHTNKSSKYIHEKFNTEHSTSEGYLIKRSNPYPKQINSKINILINNIKNTYKCEIEKLKDECRIRQTNQQLYMYYVSIYFFSQDMLLRNRDDISILIDRLRRILLNKSKRSCCIEIIQEINNQISKIHIKILVSLSLSKIARYYNLLHYAILLAKNAKRFSDSEPMLKYKIKAYEILSLCFLKLRLKQAKTYITKYLMCSWKLDKPNEELKGYDQMGKYYYYEGNIEMAQFYHNKMINGDTLVIFCQSYQKSNSSLKRLAVAKFEQGSIGKSNREKQSVNTEEADFNISSDDEPFEVIFAQEKDEGLQKAKDNFELMRHNSKKKPQLLHYQIRKQPLFDRTNVKRQQQESKNANSFIRYKQNLNDRIPRAQQTQSLLTERGTLDLSKIKGLSYAHIQLGELKNPVLLNHLSPNRCLVNYQHIELNKVPQSYKNAEDLEPLFDVGDIQKMSKNLKKLIVILTGVEEWLRAQSDLY
ncbi:unnamed protein product (macronuclear) [Paramecium tetraurelia]|uniref:Uncharacterized protein n=1 Tax=Paramecium tetraurelia TaxID=5888 RepID=A0CIN0_PARTE|nr:uncharacterized protein GSPATT00007782001 [Paramecium tetraurelia]CAK70647.1 unnamed protein product [Paramecium tetraurelia]|eukprot:XP_001438044.1 hypothetical protein (macronuclear) [Paramecium tetraurelia strain d4-2]